MLHCYTLRRTLLQPKIGTHNKSNNGREKKPEREPLRFNSRRDRFFFLRTFPVSLSRSSSVSCVRRPRLIRCVHYIFTREKESVRTINKNTCQLMSIVFKVLPSDEFRSQINLFLSNLNTNSNPN